MPRRTPAEALAAPIRTVADLVNVTIAPTAVYDTTAVRTMLRLKVSSLRREVREGRLRVSRRCGRNYFLGEWLLAWLAAGELNRRPVVHPQQ
jgi:hypothetical protein